MTQQLEKAFAEAAKLSESEQESLAEWILEVIVDEREWDDQFARSHHILDQLAAEALADFEAGSTEELDPDQL